MPLPSRCRRRRPPGGPAAIWILPCLFSLLLSTASSASQRVAGFERDAVPQIGGAVNCSDRSSSARTALLDGFSTDLDRLVDELALLGLPSGSLLVDERDRMLQALATSESARSQLCRTLEITPDLAAVPAQVLEWLGAAQRAVSGCYTDSTYTTLSAVRGAIDLAVVIADVVCDSGGCDPPTLPPSCSASCLISGGLRLISLTLETLQRLDDICSLDFHEETMAGVRSELDALRNEMDDAAEGGADAADDLVEEGATDEMLEQHAAQIDAVLGSGSRTQSSLGEQVAAAEAAFSANSSQIEGALRANLKAAIERGLASDGQSLVNLVQVPSRHGGLLELVREVTAEAIVQVDEAGGDSSPGRVLFREADALFNDDQFKAAAFRYAASYAALVEALSRAGAGGAK